MKKLLFSEKMLLVFIRYNMVPAFLHSKVPFLFRWKGRPVTDVSGSI
jgi:hypothetical protein